MLLGVASSICHAGQTLNKSFSGFFFLSFIKFTTSSLNKHFPLFLQPALSKCVRYLCPTGFFCSWRNSYWFQLQFRWCPSLILALFLGRWPRVKVSLQWKVCKPLLELQFPASVVFVRVGASQPKGCAAFNTSQLPVIAHIQCIPCWQSFVFSIGNHWHVL